MNYNGKELIEMTPGNWDGKPRKMLVWEDNSKKPLRKIIIGYSPDSLSRWVTNDANSWAHCAEIPQDAQAMKHSIDNCIDALESITNCFSTSWQDICRDVITYLESLKELKEENEKLKTECIARRKSEEEFKWERDRYKTERDELADFLGKKEDGIVGDSLGEDEEKPTSETTEMKADIVKKSRRMTNKELADLMATGKVEKCYPYYVDGRDVAKVYRTHTYYRNREDSPCAKSILIRYTGTNEWVKPMIEV